MEYFVSLQEFLREAQSFNIDSIENDVPGKTYIRFKEAFEIGPYPTRGRVHSLIVCHKEDAVTSVCLYLIASPNDTQSIWTHILHHGFFNLELYPIMIEEDYLPIKLFLAPTRY